MSGRYSDLDHAVTGKGAIALDDVGANPESLALLDIVSPKVIKLANNLIQDPPSVETAKIGTSIMAHRERRGKLNIAEGPHGRDVITAAASALLNRVL